MRSRKRSWSFLVLVIILISVGCAPVAPQSTPAAATSSAEFKLRFANFFPAPAAQGQIGEQFAADINRLTNGRVEVEYYPGGMLLGPAEIYDGVAQGIADIGLSNLGYTMGRFRETEMLDLPVGFPNAWVANNVAVDFYREYRPKEWQDTHVLTLHTSPVNNLITIDKPVRRLEDLRGLTLRGTGYIATFVEALGAAARPVPMPEAYDNLSKRVIDGLMIPYETVRTFKYGEVTSRATEIWPLGQVYTFYVVMNKQTWDKLPADLQQIVTRYVEDQFQPKLALMWNEIDLTGRRYAIETGYEIIELPPDELARWRAVADQVIEQYIRRMVADGHSEAELRSRLRFIAERIDHWVAKQKQVGIKSSTGPDEVRVP